MEREICEMCEDPIEDKFAREGTIRGIFGHPLLGLWTLEIYPTDGAPIDIVHIESGYGVRRLVDCFGSLKNSIGKTIRYATDCVGLLEWFEPVEEYHG